MSKNDFQTGPAILLKSCAERHKRVNGACFLRVHSADFHKLFHSAVEKPGSKAGAC